jgi:hypothetical protein
MNIFLIHPDGIPAVSYFLNGESGSPTWHGENASLILAINWDHPFEYPLMFSNVGFYFFHQKLLNKLLEAGMKICYTRQVDSLVRRLGDEDEILEENPYSLLLHAPNRYDIGDSCSKEANNLDVFICKYYLFVSEKALQILTDEYVFKDVIMGKSYGKEYETISNRFLVEGSIEDFIHEQMPKHREHIAVMQKKINAIYRQQQGLPPLP